MNEEKNTSKDFEEISDINQPISPNETPNKEEENQEEPIEVEMDELRIEDDEEKKMEGNETKKSIPTIEIEKIGEATENTGIIKPVTLEDIKASEEKKEPVSKNPDDKREEKPRRKGIIGILVIVLALLLFMIGTIYFIFNNSKNLFLTSINKEYGRIVTNLDGFFPNSMFKEAKNSSAIAEGTFHINMQVGDSLQNTSTRKTLEEINKLSGKYRAGMDYKNKKIGTNFSLQYDQEDMLSVNVYGTQKNMYLELKDLFAKYIKLELDEYDALFEDPNIQVDDAKYMTKTVKDAFLNSLETKDFKKTTEKIKIDGKEVKTTKITYTIDADNAQEISEKVLTKLKEDDTFMNMASKYTHTKKEELTGSIEKKIKNIKNRSDLSKDELKLSVYTKGVLNEAVRYDMEVIESINSRKQSSTLSYIKENGKSSIVLSQSGKKMADLEIEEKSKNEKEIRLSAGTVLLQAKTKETSTLTTTNFEIKETESKMKIEGKILNKNEKKNKEYIGNVEMNVKAILDDEEAFMLKMTGSSKTTIGKEVTLPNNLKESIDASELTGMDQNAIMQKLYQNPVFIKFITNLNKAANGNIQ